jgi:hypothetical protein
VFYFGLKPLSPVNQGIDAIKPRVEKPELKLKFSFYNLNTKKLKLYTATPE